MPEKKILFVSGGQAFVVRDPFRWLAMKHLATKDGSDDYFCMVHNVDAGWRQTGGSVKWKGGPKEPDYASVRIYAMSPLEENVRSTLGAPWPYNWLEGPKTSETMVSKDVEKKVLEMLMQEKGPLIRALRFYERVTSRKPEIPLPKESLLAWARELAEMFGLQRERVITTVELFRDVLGCPKPEEGEEWWIVDLVTGVREEYRWGMKVKKGSVLIPKGRYLPRVLRRMGCILFATHLPYAPPDMYVSIRLSINPADRQWIVERMEEMWKEKKSERMRIKGMAEVLDPPPFAIPSGPDAISKIFLNYRVCAEIGGWKVVF